MRFNLRTILIFLFSILIIILCASYFMFRVTKSQVVVNKMIRFDEILSDSERVLKDRETVKHFTYAVRFANKQKGIVDIEDPPFQFELGDKGYYLWVNERFKLGTLMKLPDTRTVYTIGKSRTKKLLEILNKEYDMKPFP